MSYNLLIHFIQALSSDAGKEANAYALSFSLMFMFMFGVGTYGQAWTHRSRLGLGL